MVIPKTYEDAVDVLVEAHAEDTLPPLEIWVFPDPHREVVRLLEVTDAVPYMGEVWPIALLPGSDFPFLSQLAQVTPEEWKAVLEGGLPLPDGWVLATAEKKWPS